MVRMIIGVVVGYAIWSVLWLGGNALFFKEAAAVVQGGQPYTLPSGLLFILALSFVCSLLAGLTTAAIARTKATKAVLIMAVLLLVTGIAVQAGVWDMMPVWYHLVFLGLLVPVSAIGGRMAARVV
jgi:hypothetical protein